MINIREDRTVNSFEELAALVQPFRKDGDWIFRGVRQSNYKLIPKIGRSESRKAIGSGGSLPYDREAEETMIRHFVRSAAPYVKHVPATRLAGDNSGDNRGQTTFSDFSDTIGREIVVCHQLFSRRSSSTPSSRPSSSAGPRWCAPPGSRPSSAGGGQAAP